MPSVMTLADPPADTVLPEVAALAGAVAAVPGPHIWPWTEAGTFEGVFRRIAAASAAAAAIAASAAEAAAPYAKRCC